LLTIANVINEGSVVGGWRAKMRASSQANVERIGRMDARSDHGRAAGMAEGAEGYSGIARFFHWTTVLVVIGMLSAGFYMTYRGKVLNIWDDTTNLIYTSHKLLGFILLWFIVLRLLYRLLGGAPAPEPSLSGFQRVVSALNHWGLYALLITMPILGWLSVSLYPAINIFGWFDLPALTTPDKAAYKVVSYYHGIGARVLLGLLSLHVLAALYHLVIRRDGVFRRMWSGPSRS